RMQQRGRSLNRSLQAAATAVAATLLLTMLGLPSSGQRSEQTPAAVPEAGALVALIIGNGRLEGSLALPQPAAGAAAVAERLRVRGFRIISLDGGSNCGEGRHQTDLDRQAMQAVLTCFTGAARGAAQAIFYFSGHSIMLDGRNYLLPVG